ncbi:MAG: molybdopterin-dependent oxidoreductase [Candidatus Aminicenantales bacterium]
MKIRLDGREVHVEGRKTLLQVAREQGVFLPTLCEHPRLEPFGGCRMCLVEIKSGKGFAPACSTWAEEGQDVTTNSPQIADLRKNILALILCEHPSACLICEEKDKCDDLKSTIRKAGEVTGCVLCGNNGRCRLQDLVRSVGFNALEFRAVYRNFEVRRDDPFFDRNYNLCILCGRCVRICQEVRGASVISFVGRGLTTSIAAPFDGKLLDSGCRFCGACVDSCPTGALMERAVRYEPPPDRIAPVVCPLCSQGCKLEVGFRGDRPMASHPAENGPVNRGQACVLGRFAVRDAVTTPARVLEPLVRTESGLVPASWDEALRLTAAKLGGLGKGETAFRASSQLPVEDLYLFLKIFRKGLDAVAVAPAGEGASLGTAREAARKHRLDLSLNFDLGELSRAGAFLVLGTDLATAHPMIWLEVLAAVRKGASLVVAHTGQVTFDRYASPCVGWAPGGEGVWLQALTARLSGKPGGRPAGEGNRVSPADVEAAAKALSGKGPIIILAGSEVFRRPRGETNFEILWNLALAIDAHLVPLGDEINERARDEFDRAIPGPTRGWDKIVSGIRERKIRALFLAGSAPDLSGTRPEFLVCQTPYLDGNALHADIVLPSATFVESGGTFVNVAGRIQTFSPGLEPRGESRPDWRILSELAAKLGFRSWEVAGPDALRREIAGACPAFGSSFGGPTPARFLLEPKAGIRRPVPVVETPAPPVRPAEFPFALEKVSGTTDYRGFDLRCAAGGLKRIRDPRRIFLNAGDASAAGIEEGMEIAMESASGRASGTARIAGGLPAGTAEASAEIRDSLSDGASGPGILFVTIRRKS